MATITHGVSLAVTTNGNSYPTGPFTPAAGDLLVLFVHPSGTLAPSGTVTDSQGLGWTKITGALSRASGDNSTLWVSNATAAATSMTVTFSCPSDAATGCDMEVLRVSGMSRTGAAAVRQSNIVENHALGTTAASFTSAALTGNPTIGAVNNASSPATMTPPTSWTEAADVGYSTPTTGLEVIYRNSGFTGTTITWGSSSATAFSVIIAELDTSVPNTPPTVTADTAGAVATYYFDGHGGISDPDNEWTNDANGFDGNTTDEAVSGTVNAGSSTSHYLLGKGTTAPASGASISQVRVRAAQLSGSTAGQATIYTAAAGETLGIVVPNFNYSSYVVLTAPAAGWTWDVLQNLEIRVYVNGANGGFAARLSRAEIEVTTAPNFTTATPTLAFTGSDAQSDDLQYEVQIDTVSTFNSQSITATPAFVQSTAANNAAASPGTVTLNGVTTGNAIMVSTVVATGTANIVTGVTDTAGNTYTKDYEVNNSGQGLTVARYTALNVTGGNLTISIAFNATSTNMSAIVTEYSGIATSSALDGTPVSTAPVGVGLSETTPSLTTSQANELLIGHFATVAGSETFTAGSGYGDLSPTGAGASGMVITEDAVQASTGSYTASMSWSATSGHIAALAAYKSGSGTGPLVDKFSAANPGFLDVPNNADTAPFTAGNQVSYTVQSALANGTYYWRVRAVDPSGTNTYSSWSTTRSFTVSAGGGSVITSTQPGVARIAVTKSIAQAAAARLAKNQSKTQPAAGRVAITRALTQAAASRVSLVRNTTQPVTSRLARTLTKTQTAVSRIANTGLVKTQSATARIALTRALTQSSTGRIANTRLITQPAVAHISIIKVVAQPATARITKGVSKTQPAVARMAANGSKTQSAASRLALVMSKTQPAVARMTRSFTLTQPATAAITVNVGAAKTQNSVARIAVTKTFTQNTAARIAKRANSTQPALGRIAYTKIMTQPVIARLSANPAKTQPATGRIARNLPLVQPVVARIALTYAKTQTAVAHTAQKTTKLQPATGRLQTTTSLIQPATANITRNGIFSKTQPATGRIALSKGITQSSLAGIAITGSKLQPAQSRIAQRRLYSQPGISRIAKAISISQPVAARLARNRSLINPAASRISRTLTTLQPAGSRVARTLTKFQPATASITQNLASAKTQPAAARLAANRNTMQGAMARLAVRNAATQPARSRIAAGFTKTQLGVSRISISGNRTQPATARIIAILTGVTTQPATARLSRTRNFTQAATARILHYDYIFTSETASSSGVWTAETGQNTVFTPSAATGGGSWIPDSGSTTTTIKTDTSSTSGTWTVH